MASPKEVRDALLDLLDDLQKMDIKKLKRNEGGAANNKLLSLGERPTPRRKLPGFVAVSSSPEEWEETLRRAAEDIPEWCFSFSIELDPEA